MTRPRVSASGPADRPARDRLVTVFDRNFLVEAGAGAGKTECLARRMAAGIAAGLYTVDRLAAVTFTRKAAAELRGRFQRAIEGRLADPARPPTDVERTRLQRALAGLEALSAGTIHSFCARLLRERPVEARLAPDAREIDEVEDARLRREAWRQFLAARRAEGWEVLRELQEAGLRPSLLDEAFARVCDHADVAFPADRTTRPDLAGLRARVDRHVRAWLADAGGAIDPDTTCRLQAKVRRLSRRLRFARPDRPALIVSALEDFDCADSGLQVVQKRWADKATALRVREEALAFRDREVRPFLVEWREYLYGLCTRVLCEGRDHYRDARRRLNLVNYVDLLVEATRLLREHPHVRVALQRRFPVLLVDEFQDTDPVQAELMLWLAAADAGDAHAPADAWRVALRPGALFIVGDPKQSIYRFRRADLGIYAAVRDRLARPDAHGEVLSLTSNFRSHPRVCAFANRVFEGVFPETPTDVAPGFEPLVAAGTRPGAGPYGVLRLTVPAGTRQQAEEWEADRIADYVAAEIARGRPCGDFLVLTMKKDALARYAAALVRRDVPVEVSGAGRFHEAPEVRALAQVLRAIADAADRAALVGVLRGPLFGLSDRELFAYKQSGAPLDLGVPVPGEEGGAAPPAGEPGAGPVARALRVLRGWAYLVRTLPLPVALDRMLDDSGWLALGAATDRGAAGGRLLQAVDVARVVLGAGGGLAELVAALDEEADPIDSEAWPLEAGRADVVRVMNVHKAKGLEARVVFLAAPASVLPAGVDFRVTRQQGVAEGHFVIRHRRGEFRNVTLAAPAGWADDHELAERKHRLAELDRLAYVAATRAGDLLVVGCLPRDDAGTLPQQAWSRLAAHLDDAEELPSPRPPAPAARPVADLSEAVVAGAAGARAAAHAALGTPSWAVVPVTREAERLRPRVFRADGEVVDPDAAAFAQVAAPVPPRAGAPGARAGITVLAASSSEPAVRAIVPDTPAHLADGGLAWGALVHGLLEHALRARDRRVPREELVRLAAWLTLEVPDLRPHLGAAADLVIALRESAFWERAVEAAACHVEVPFAMVLRPGEPGVDGRPVALPTVLRGVIDAVHSEPDGGWTVIDYKTDRDGHAEAVRAKYEAQVATYRQAWLRVGD